MKKLLALLLICSACHKTTTQPQTQSQPPAPQTTTKEIKFIVDSETDSVYVYATNLNYPNSTGLLMNNFTHTFVTNQPQRQVPTVYSIQANCVKSDPYIATADTIRIRAYLDGILQSNTKVTGTNFSSIVY